MMNQAKLIFCISLFMVYLSFTNYAISQQATHIDGGDYKKTIEYNIILPGVTKEHDLHNLESKSILDRILFGSKNGLVEFVFEDSPEGSNKATAFRVTENLQEDSYNLEVMQLQNMHEVYKIQNIILDQTTQIKVPDRISYSLSTEFKNYIKEHNELAQFKGRDDFYKPYRPDPTTLQVSKEFVDKLHNKTSKLIDSFKAEGIQAMIMDGYRVTFRCVVDDELWSLNIHMPQKEARQLSDIFKQMIEDGLNGDFDEKKYMKLLD